MVSDGPPFAVDAGALEVLDRLWQAGHGAYLVGGGVRDALLGLEVNDWDVATDARPERILRIFPGSTYQNRFGTVLAGGLEITTFRRDHHYADHRRPDKVVFSDDIHEDLARRDLTINAIAWGRSRPEARPGMVDPADGRGDLDASLVRAVGDPDRRFDEDALRLLRTVRIAARLRFDIEPVTWAALVAHAHDMTYVSEERIGSELRRMLAAAEPSRALHLLIAGGILAGVAPELAGSADLETALMMVDRTSEECPGDERLALAALLGWLDAEAARRVLDRWRISGHDSDAVIELIASAAQDYRSDWSDADVRRYMARVRTDLLDDLLVLLRVRSSRHDRSAAPADDVATTREAELAGRVAEQRATDPPLKLADLAIDGRDLRKVLGLPEGPLIGRILERLLADVVEEPALNERSKLLARASTGIR